MRRTIFLFSVVFLLPQAPLRAGNLFEVAAVGGISFPLRGLGTLVGSGLKASAFLQFNLNDNIGIGVCAGYTRWTFDSDKINRGILATGSPAGFGIRGPFQAIPVMVGARLTLDGSPVRPYLALFGGAYFVHWEISGTSTAGGSAVLLPPLSKTWTEPATSLDAGLILAITESTWLDIGASYTAFSNSDDKLESTDYWGKPIVTVNTATSIALVAGVRVAL